MIPVILWLNLLLSSPKTMKEVSGNNSMRSVIFHELILSYF